MPVLALAPGELAAPLPRLDRQNLVHARCGQAVLAARDHKAALGHALNRDWKHALVAPISDAQLSMAVDAMFQYHLSVGYFGDRLKGMQHLTNLDKDGFLEAELTPNRKGIPSNRHALNPAECPLCNPPDKRERGLSWRSWIVWPNAYPYVPAEQQHTVIMPARHRAQGFSAPLLGDMIDYQRLASKEAPVSLHYNGIAGNSQFHLHWQSSRVTFPLQRELDSGRLQTKPLRKDAQGAVEMFERPASAGFIVHGSRAYVMKMAEVLVRKLDKDPLTEGAYNLSLLQQRKGEARLVIIPRCAGNLNPHIEGLPPVGLGAFSLSGILVLSTDEAPTHLADKMNQLASMTLVPPRMFSWLNEVAKQPL
jgi:hypothetical protein